MKVNLWKLFAQIAVVVIFVAALLFAPAGTFAWPAGWLFLGLFAGFIVALSLWLLRHDPNLLAERMDGVGQADQSAADKALLAIIGLLFFAWLALMAIDAVRMGWSRVPPPMQGTGAAVLVVSFYLFYRTYRENTYLSPAVRVQTERAQSVVTSGPYRHVRHPMYSAFTLFAVGTPLLLGSWYGLFGAAVLVALLARRAVLEERVLRDRLHGYRDYLAQVRYRFVPLLW